MTYFKVFFHFDKTQIIEANSYKEAAINYCDKLPIKEDIGIWVVEKGFRNRKKMMQYKTSELIPERIQTRTGNKDFDESKLDSYSLELLNQIKQYSPEWVDNIANYGQDWCGDSDFTKSGFFITIPNPFQSYHPIEISTTYSKDDLELSFGRSWMDWYELLSYANATWSEWNKNIESVYEAILDIVTELIEEKLISCNARHTKGIGSVNGIFLTEDEYNLTKEQDTLLQAVSWKGTYNYQKYI